MAEIENEHAGRIPSEDPRPGLLTRRRAGISMVKLAALAATTAAFVACGFTAPDEGSYEQAAEKPNNPILNAASVLIQVNIGSKYVENAHGGIFQTDGGKFALYTADHVINGEGYGRVTQTQALFPGDAANAFRWIQEEWKELTDTQATESDGSRDGISQIPLHLVNGDPLLFAIRGGIIKPLQAVPFTAVQVGQKVALPMPDQPGKFATLAYQGWDSESNLINFTLVGGKGCQGYSGMPLLLLDEAGQPTNQSIGLFTFGEVHIGDECTTVGDLLGGIPFPSPIIGS